MPRKYKKNKTKQNTYIGYVPPLTKEGRNEATGTLEISVTVLECESFRI
jgi:hypothetical protein